MVETSLLCSGLLYAFALRNSFTHTRPVTISQHPVAYLWPGHWSVPRAPSPNACKNGEFERHVLPTTIINGSNRSPDEANSGRVVSARRHGSHHHPAEIVTTLSVPNTCSIILSPKSGFFPFSPICFIGFGKKQQIPFNTYVYYPMLYNCC